MGSNYCRSLVLVNGNKAVDRTVSPPHMHFQCQTQCVYCSSFFFRRALVCSNHTFHLQMPLHSAQNAYNYPTGWVSVVRCQKIKQNKQMHNQRAIVLFQSKLLRPNGSPSCLYSVFTFNRVSKGWSFHRTIHHCFIGLWYMDMHIIFHEQRQKK